MSTAAPEPKANMGQPVPRYDAVAKVTGRARYAADVPLANPAFAYLVTSAIAKGRVESFDLADAKKVRGVIDIITHENAEKLKDAKLFSNGGYTSTTVQPLKSADVAHDGQIIAVVVAETFEAAREAAHRVKVSYSEDKPTASFDSPGTTSARAKGQAARFKDDPKVGDFAGAFDQAEVKLTASYETPTQHHNPMELFATSCVWNGDSLTVYEPSQYVTGLKNGVAEQLGIDPDNVRVINDYVGGAFGSKGSMTPRTAIIASIARRLNRPVKLVATRDQGFTIATYRAETRHEIQIGASRDGKLVALRHEGAELSSRPDPYAVGGTKTTTRLYACPNVDSLVSIVRADRNTPGFMRSPPEVPYLFALESAMDELAVKLNMDPIELATNQRHHEGADRRQGLHLAVADGLFRRGCQGVRLVAARGEAEIDGRRRLADRLWLRHHLLSDASGAGRGAGAIPQGRPRARRDRRPRDRQRRLHRDRAGGVREARRAL